MATRTDPASKARAAVTRERVLRAATALADKEGLGSLSMRKLGQQLGVEAMSLYNHVANKDDVLDGMVDIVFGEIDLPSGRGHWKRDMRRRALSTRDTLSRHPWAVGLMESRTTPGPATLQHHEAVLRSLRGAGFSVEMAAHAYSVMDSYIYGFALQQQTLPAGAVDEQPPAAREFMSRFRPEDYPHLTEMITEHAMQPGYDYAKEFEFGLDLILEGLEALR